MAKIETMRERAKFLLKKEKENPSRRKTKKSTSKTMPKKKKHSCH